MILLVPSTSAASGVVTYIAAAASVLEPSKYTCLVVAGSDLAGMLPGEAQVLETDGSMRDIASKLATHRGSFSVVQTHGRRALVAARLARWPSHRLAHVFHETPNRHAARAWVERGLALRVHKAANSPETARRMQGVRGRLPTLLPPIVTPFRTLPRVKAREAMRIAPNCTCMGVVGHLSPVKRPELALQSIDALPEPMRSGSQTVFVGDGPMRGEIQEAAAALRLRVAITGTVPDARSLLSAFDVLISPSPYETFGLAVAEAAIANVPLAVVDSPGARFMGGELLEMTTPAAPALADAVRRAFNTPVLHLQRLRDSILAQFGPSAARERYQRYYEELERPA
jgi:glycosyltransferase involved in cell wall biosynthesis